MYQVNDPTGGYTIAYDNMGRQIGTATQYAFPPGKTHTAINVYDAASNRTTLQAPDGSTNTYTYDTLNRLSNLSSTLTGAFGFGYDNLSRRTSLTRPNGITTSYGYDNLSHLLSVLHKNSGNTILDGATYTYDNAGNRLTKLNSLNSVTEGYTYDPLYQLTQVVQGATTTESYGYDLVGNRLSSLGVSPYNYNSSNELTSTPSGSYTYDNNGNTLTDPSGKSYTWDFENRLTQVVVPGTGTVTFKYDPFGRRVQKSAPSGTVNYLYDGMGKGANTIEEVDNSGNILARYTQGLGIDEPFAEVRSGANSYYRQDGLGSVSSLSSSSATLTKTYTYNAFGKLTASTGSVTNPWQYTSREFDAETGLNYYRARYLDVLSSRFLNEDALGFIAGTNFYDYVRNNPVNLIDPTGMQGKPSYRPTGPANPNTNTYVCDGRGGAAVQLGNTGTRQETACTKDCIVAHEINHIIRALVVAPSICIGEPAGTGIGIDIFHDLSSEFAAYSEEATCLQNSLARSCRECRKIIERRLKWVEWNRDDNMRVLEIEIRRMRGQ